MPVPLQNQKFPLWPSFPLINKPFNLNKLHSSAISKRRHLHCQLLTTLWGEELCPLLKGLPCCILCLGFGINGAQSSQLSGWYPFKGIISQNCWGRAQFSFASECGANCLTVMASLFGRCRTCRRNLLSSLARRVSSVLTKYKLEPSMDEDWWKVTRPRAQIRPSLSSIGSQRVGHDWSGSACTHVLEKEMATHSSILAWRIPGTEEPGGLRSIGSHRVGHDWSDSACIACMHACGFWPPLLARKNGQI